MSRNPAGGLTKFAPEIRPEDAEFDCDGVFYKYGRFGFLFRWDWEQQTWYRSDADPRALTLLPKLSRES